MRVAGATQEEASSWRPAGRVRWRARACASYAAARVWMGPCSRRRAKLERRGSPMRSASGCDHTKNQ
eukprot:3810399-Prymnesium_polylepis.2